MLSQSHSTVVKKKLSLALVKAKIVRFLMGFDIDEGINSKDAAFACYGRCISGRICGRFRLEQGQAIDYLKQIFPVKM